ncbi:MAG: hypothetical protein QXN08_01255 [Nitrososphaerales archaeon]
MSLWESAEIISKDKLNLKTLYIGSTPPDNPSEGQLWHDTSEDALKQRIGGSWVKIPDIKREVASQSVEPNTWVDLLIFTPTKLPCLLTVACPHSWYDANQGRYIRYDVTDADNNAVNTGFTIRYSTTTYGGVSIGLSQMTTYGLNHAAALIQGVIEPGVPTPIKIRVHHNLPSSTTIGVEVQYIA